MPSEKQCFENQGQHTWEYTKGECQKQNNGTVRKAWTFSEMQGKVKAIKDAAATAKQKSDDDGLADDARTHAASSVEGTVRKFALIKAQCSGKRAC